VEVPALRQRERGDEQNGRNDTAEGSERDQPHEILRREHLGEGQEAGDARGEEQPGLDPAAEHDEPRRERGNHCEHGAHRRQRVRETAGEVTRHRGRSPHHRGVVEPEPVGGEQNARAEALRVQCTPDLRVDAVPDAARREREPRQDEHCEHGRERSRGRRRSPGSPRAPDPDHRQRRQQHRVQLRRGRNAEQGEREPATAGDQSGNGGGAQRGRPRVVGVQRDRAEGDRGKREEDCRPDDAKAARALAHQYERHAEDRGQTAQGHQHLEDRVVGTAGGERRGGEERDRAGRVLDEEIAIRNPPSQERVAVFAVEMQIAELPAAEKATARHGERPEQKRRDEDGRSQRDARRALAHY